MVWEERGQTGATVWHHFIRSRRKEGRVGKSHGIIRSGKCGGKVEQPYGIIRSKHKKGQSGGTVCPSPFLFFSCLSGPSLSLPYLSGPSRSLTFPFFTFPFLTFSFNFFLFLPSFCYPEPSSLFPLCYPFLSCPSLLFP